MQKFTKHHTLSQLRLKKCPILTGRYATKLFDCLKDEIILSCLFTKSFWFKPENEIRVAFEVPYNASSIPFRFECKDLLNYIEIIHL